MTTEREVLEFIIVPPFKERAAVGAAKERLEHYLGNRFPGYSFKVGPFAPVGDEEEFCVLPLMNFVGDDGNNYMCTPPRRWLLQEIAHACRGFDLKGLRHSAA
ncbi:hypothetical protein Rleg2_2459 [Rhizobium leguminosarum bv. trifolii WSM2304]|uniref:Uncharacterized protein n=1 Tax=Rhizobium leguminosarum bv. trifolii (strain WSM2304) TaxID=395492 RepID=A0ABF7QN85_RHILW|nr:hypothetical protein [Rhizobium leguminosarum]ACI55733.1 hypothetical protein Rleg2_2459 [Rhizobium leguminosarum bv. trifolii WSM2304]